MVRADGTREERRIVEVEDQPLEVVVERLSSLLAGRRERRDRENAVVTVVDGALCVTWDEPDMDW